MKTAVQVTSGSPQEITTGDHKGAGDTITTKPGTPPTIHVMTWNIRRLIPALMAREHDRWETRAPRVSAAIVDTAPTILAIQESMPEQTAFLRDVLGSRYQFVGQGRGRDNAGEATPIFFDSKRLELITWEQRALSNRPGKPGSVSWGNIFPRAFVAATVRDRHTGTRFLIINTHLDHLSSRSRIRSAGAIGEFIQKQTLPAMVLGDFNATQGSKTHGAFTRSGALSDIWSVADQHLTQAWGTFPNYKDPTPGGRRIDWILSTSDWQVHGAGINARQYAGGWASDHLSVHALMIPPGNTGNDALNDRQFHPPTQGLQ